MVGVDPGLAVTERHAGARAGPQEPVLSDAPAGQAPHGAIAAVVGVAERHVQTRRGLHEEQQGEREQHAGRQPPLAARDIPVLPHSPPCRHRRVDREEIVRDLTPVRHDGGVVQRPPAGTIPESPGSYQFKDRDGRVIYVGKAKSLRQRLSNYFGNPSLLPPRTAQMVAAAESVEWIQVRNDVEALMLEYSLIQKHKPRFNVRYRDDKSYPFLAVTMEDDWPRAMVMRGQKRKGVRYFGPYGHAYAIRETLDLLLRTFPIRTCSDNKLERHHKLGRPCLLFHIEKCSGPCVGEIDSERYERLVT